MKKYRYHTLCVGCWSEDYTNKQDAIKEARLQSSLDSEHDKTVVFKYIRPVTKDEIHDAWDIIDDLCEKFPILELN